MAVMPSVRNLHKASSLAGLTQGHINSDGTSLNNEEKKLVGTSNIGYIMPTISTGH